MISTNPLSKVVNPNPGWYRGDFHVHTNESDGVYLPDLVEELAIAEGLDFIAYTDHNTMEGYKKLRKDLDFIVIPGIEMSLDKGHFNVFGMDEWRDWMDNFYGNIREISLPTRYPTVNELIAKIADQGLLNSINHPLLAPWAWQYTDTDLSRIHCLEIWNDLYWPENINANPIAVNMWTKWLNAGHRITAIGGSDYHSPPRPEEGIFGERLGFPTTFVYADELSVAGIIEGVRKHRVYVSRGIMVNFEAEINDQIFGIGADVGKQVGKITFTATILSKFSTTQAQLIKNGQVMKTVQADGMEAKISFNDTLDGVDPAWYRLEISAPEGQVMAITNPIFTGPRRVPTIFKYGDF